MRSTNFKLLQDDAPSSIFDEALSRLEKRGAEAQSVQALSNDVDHLASLLKSLDAFIARRAALLERSGTDRRDRAAS